MKREREQGTGTGDRRTVLRSDEPLFGFGELGLALFVPVDGFPGGAGGVGIALVNEAEVIGAVADDRAVACVQRVHPLDLVAGDTGVPEGQAARCTEARAGEASERVEGECVDGAAEKVGNEQGGGGEEEGEEERVVACWDEKSAGLEKQAGHCQVGRAWSPRHDDVKTRREVCGVAKGLRMLMAGRSKGQREREVAASMKQPGTPFGGRP